MKEKCWALYNIQLFGGFVCVYIRSERAQSRRLLSQISQKTAVERYTISLDLFCSIISQDREVNFSHIFVEISVAESTRSWSINFDLKS